MELDPRVRPVIDRLFPAAEQVVLLSAGWDSTAYAIDGKWIVRIPKREEIATQYRHERRVLRLLSSAGLPLAIPEPLETDSSLADVLVYPMIHGVPYAEAVWPADSPLHASVLHQVGGFLDALHRLPTSGGANLHPFPWTGIDRPDAMHDTSTAGWRKRVAQFGDAAARSLAECDPLLANRLTETFAAFLAEEEHFAFVLCLIHGDFSADHVLVDPQTGQVTGIIDWGDSGLGDPAYDLWPGMPQVAQGEESVRSRCAFYRRIAPVHAWLFALKTNDIALRQQALARMQVQFASGSPDGSGRKP